MIIAFGTFGGFGLYHGLYGCPVLLGRSIRQGATPDPFIRKVLTTLWPTWDPSAAAPTQLDDLSGTLPTQPESLHRFEPLSHGHSGTPPTQTQGSHGFAAPSNTSASDRFFEKLQALMGWRSQGYLSDSEFLAAKRELRLK